MSSVLYSVVTTCERALCTTRLLSFVYEYTQEFNNLAQHDGHHVDSGAKKAELYHKGLNIQL
jgi:hypothetical protein